MKESQRKDILKYQEVLDLHLAGKRESSPRLCNSIQKPVISTGSELCFMLTHRRSSTGSMAAVCGTTSDTWQGLTSVSELSGWSHHLPFALLDAESPDWTTGKRKVQLYKTTNFTKATTLSKYYCLSSHGLCSRAVSIVPPHLISWGSK